MRIVQVGDVAAVAPAIAEVLRGQADVISLPLRQRGARLPSAVKPLAAPLRLLDAAVAARRASALGPDVVHIHWVPNGLVGLLLPGRPWVLHAHGSDLRALDAVRGPLFRFLVRAATGLVFATPDLGPIARRMRPDAVLLPAPIPIREGVVERDLDVLIGSRAALSKGSDVAAAAVARLRRRRPDVRIAAVDGPHFAVDAERLPFQAKDAFIECLARSRVVVGQFRVPALGITELEAMSVARPVVTNLDPSLYPDPPPVSVAPDAEAAADEIARLLERPEEADALGWAGQAWVRRHHAPAEVAAVAMAAYRAAIGRSKARR